MTTAVSSKLVAKVISSVDLDTLFPNSSLKGQVAFDIHVEKGALSTGKRVFLRGGLGKEEIVIRGIEMESHEVDPNNIRIHCSKPKSIEIPLTKNEAWIITEE